jgi:hypothetical protein
VLSGPAVPGSPPAREDGSSRPRNRGRRNAGLTIDVNGPDRETGALTVAIVGLGENGTRRSEATGFMAIVAAMSASIVSWPGSRVSAAVVLSLPSGVIGLL